MKIKSKKKILVIAPNTWSYQELMKRNSEYEFIFHEDQFQKEKVSIFHKLRLIFGLNFKKGVDEIVKIALEKKVDGILGADDYISCLYASKACEILKFNGSNLKLDLTFQHKYYSRRIQQKILGKYIPKFSKNLKENNIEFPIFAKPIRGSASLLACKITSVNELKKYKKVGLIKKIVLGRMLNTFEKLAEREANLPLVDSHYIFEELIEGEQCTLEGVVYKGQHKIIGITDSIMYPNSKIAFSNFNFPSKLDNKVCVRMEEIAKKLIDEAGFSFGFYNVEFFYNQEKDEIHIIEINPRMAFQFTDLYEKVLGVNTFDLWLKMIINEDLNLDEYFNQKKGKHEVAISFVKRRFNDGYVLSIPDQELIEVVQKDFSDSRILIQAEKNQKLSDDVFQDMESFRLMTVNLGGKSILACQEMFNLIENKLKFEIRDY